MCDLYRTLIKIHICQKEYKREKKKRNQKLQQKRSNFFEIFYGKIPHSEDFTISGVFYFLLHTKIFG